VQKSLLEYAAPECDSRKESEAAMMKASTYLGGIKYRAEQRQLVWQLTDEEAQGLFTTACSYCGAVPSPFTGIDRIDSMKGYVKENCAPCCGYCNFMKGTLSREDFLARIERIHIYQQSLRFL
jgi:hypothetical protein